MQNNKQEVLVKKCILLNKSICHALDWCYWHYALCFAIFRIRVIRVGSCLGSKHQVDIRILGSCFCRGKTLKLPPLYNSSVLSLCLILKHVQNRKTCHSNGYCIYLSVQVLRWKNLFEVDASLMTSLTTKDLKSMNTLTKNCICHSSCSHSGKIRNII